MQGKPTNADTMTEDLLRRYLAGDVNDRERAQVAEWLDASPENMRRFRALRRLSDLLIWQLPPQPVSRKVSGRIRKLRYFKVAAAIILLGVVGVWIFQAQLSAPKAELNTVHVPAGQHIELQLADGTKVWLNAKSDLFFPDHFDEHERRVKLTGEGFFDVVSDPARPFIVETPSYDVQALGTEFDVMAYGPDSLFQTLLVGGKVKVTDRKRQDKVILSSREQVYVENGQLVKAPLKDYNQLSWKEGLLVFKNETFSSMILRLERYFDVTIDVRKEQLLERHYTGKFRINDGLEHILKVLSLDGTFQYRFEENTNRVLIH